jgi:hypothetical protein
MANSAGLRGFSAESAPLLTMERTGIEPVTSALQKAALSSCKKR